MSSPGWHPSGPLPPVGHPAAALPYLHGGPVDFGEAIKQALRNRFVYRGRASRSAYWWFALLQLIVSVAQLFIVLAFGVAAAPAQTHTHVVTGAGHFIFLVVLIVFFAWLWFVGLPQLALLVRRLHDTGKSGWWILIGFVPVVGPVILLIFTLLEGTPGLNRYQL